MQKWLKLHIFGQKIAKNFFLKKRRTTLDIFQYWSVFTGILRKSGQYLVSILGKSGQYSGQYTDVFFTDHSCHHWIGELFQSVVHY